MAKADEFWSEKEYIAITDETKLGKDTKYREVVKYRAKSKILKAFNSMKKIENPRIVTDRILITSLDVVIHFLKLREQYVVAEKIEDIQKELSVELLS